MKTIRIGAGAGYSGDRIEPAIELAEQGDINYLVFECLAERTIALAQQAKRKDPTHGYDPLLEARLHAVLSICCAKGIKIITNMGAANPVSAVNKSAEIARMLGLNGLKIAAVTGDNVPASVCSGNYRLEETGATVAQLGDRIVSANAYLGVAPIVAALAAGADLIITGRTADPALFLAPLIHEFGWVLDDWDKLGQGTVVGHLLECAGQITGGYFADPGFKDVENLARLGFPIGEVNENGDLIVTKVAGSGGQVTRATCKEQLLYEIHDPARYFQPDVVADFSQVIIEELGKDRVRVTGGRGQPKTGTVKVSVGYVDGYIGEGQLSYAGPGARARGQLALDIVRQRLQLTGVQTRATRFDLIGINALHGPEHAPNAEPDEVRIRVVGRTDSLAEAVRIGNEVESLYTNGPAGGGGAFKTAREVMAVQSVLLPAALVQPSIQIVEA